VRSSAAAANLSRNCLRRSLDACAEVWRAAPTSMARSRTAANRFPFQQLWISMLYWTLQAH